MPAEGVQNDVATDCQLEHVTTSISQGGLAILTAPEAQAASQAGSHQLPLNMST